MIDSIRETAQAEREREEKKKTEDMIICRDVEKKKQKEMTKNALLVPELFYSIVLKLQQDSIRPIFSNLTQQISMHSDLLCPLSVPGKQVFHYIILLIISH